MITLRYFNVYNDCNEYIDLFQWLQCNDYTVLFQCLQWLQWLHCLIISMITLITIITQLLNLIGFSRYNALESCATPAGWNNLLLKLTLLTGCWVSLFSDVHKPNGLQS